MWETIQDTAIVTMER